LKNCSKGVPLKGLLPSSGSLLMAPRYAADGNADPLGGR
jgi:hypothetical protein